VKKSLLKTLARLVQEMSIDLATPGGPDESVPTRNGAATPQATPSPMSGIPGLEPAAQAVLSPFGAPDEAVLRAPIDTANCGEYSFSLYNVQLIISMLGTGGGVGGEYDVSRMTPQEWTALLGRDGAHLPIVVLRDHAALTVRVGNLPVHSMPTATPTR